MKKPIYLFALSFLLAALMGCQKSDAEILGIVSTDEVENYFGTTVEVCYSDDTKMYFHLLSDTTAEVVNYYRFYTVQEEQSPWIYRGDIVIPDRFVHNGKTYKVTCIGEGAFMKTISCWATPSSASLFRHKVSTYTRRAISGVCIKTLLLECDYMD